MGTENGRVTVKGPSTASNALRRSGAAILLCATVAAASACGARARGNDIEAELAALRAEQRALAAEVAALRDEMQSLAQADVETPETPRPTSSAPAAEQATQDLGAAIAAVLDAYRQALEAEDLQLMARVYGGTLPAEDLRYVEIWFERTDGMRVQLDPRSIEVRNGTADAILEQTVIYRLNRTREQRTVRLEVRISMQRRGDDWHVSRVTAKL